MNYREQQWRQIIKRDYVPKGEFQALSAELHNLQFQHNQTLIDVDYQLQVRTKEENERLQAELSQNQAFLAEQYDLVQEQEDTIEGLSKDLATKTSTLAQQKALLQQLLAEKQEQLKDYD